MKAALAATLALAAALPAQAQTWPSKPLRVVVPFTAAGATDTTARIVAALMLMTPAEFDTHIRKEIASNAALFRAAGVTVN